MIQLMAVPERRNRAIRAPSPAAEIRQPSRTMKKYIPVPAFRTVANRPAFSPPNHAAAPTAKSEQESSTSAPRTSARTNRCPNTIAAVAATATR
jgi:hypothetical protein